ncbi:hypothetical protein FRC07_008940 [Ceratobasidium sp. 392]|nr:hypothetical protein FRC07_008940 [Ceratobasidium sp. 392]
MSNNSGPKPAEPRIRRSLASSEMEDLLEKNGDRQDLRPALFGITVDESTGPLRSSSQVATPWIPGQTYSASWVREENGVDTEVIWTDRERHTNYVREGWSQSTLSALAQFPWVSSRVSEVNETAKEGSWVTKKTTVKRLTVNIPIRALKPVPEFEAEIQEALGKDSKEEQFQSVYDTLAFW